MAPLETRCFEGFEVLECIGELSHRINYVTGLLDGSVEISVDLGSIVSVVLEELAVVVFHESVVFLPPFHCGNRELGEGFNALFGVVAEFRWARLKHVESVVRQSHIFLLL